MRNSHLFWIALFLAQLAALATCSGQGSQAGSNGLPAPQDSAYGRLPLSFEANQGQTDSRVRFLAHGRGYSLFLTADEAVLALKGHQPSAVSGQSNRTTNGGVQRTTNDVLFMRFVGANPAASVAGADELPGRSNYFIGNDPKNWRTDVPNYAKVRESNLYRGVDLVYYGNQGQMEYDFRVAPGADPSRIGFEIAGAGHLRINKSGDLEVEAGGGTVILRRPLAYQESARGKRPVEVRYVRRGQNLFGFSVGSYRRSQPIVIDPVLAYSTYLGGSGGDVAYAVGVDSAGSSYVAGETNSTNFPTQAPEQSSSGGNGDGFVSKLNADGTLLVYSTYLGGSGADSVAALAVDSKGDVFLTGQTTSTNFPITPKSSSSSGTTPTAFQTV